MNFLKLIFMLIALGVVGWQLRLLQLAKASQCWRHTKGKVVRSYVDEHAHRGRYGTTYTYSANVVYTYHVGGRQIESRHLTYEPTTGLSEDAATQLLDGITEGADLDVYYDPEDWERAVLIPGSSSGNILHLALSIGFLVAVIWVCLFVDFNAPPSHRYR